MIEFLGILTVKFIDITAWIICAITAKYIKNKFLAVLAAVIIHNILLSIITSGNVLKQLIPSLIFSAIIVPLFKWNYNRRDEKNRIKNDVGII